MIGMTVSHYRILSRLGAGGMGEVYTAEDTHLGRHVAIKFPTVRPESTQFRARFLGEARAASALNHPNIAAIYDYGETPDGQPFLVMELVNGESLFDLLHRGEMAIEQAARIVEETAEALGEAHRHGIIHRDIKPTNIVLNERGQVKVLDFGLAKALVDRRPPSGEADSTMTSAETLEGTLLGTPQYMSPEQAQEVAMGPPSDLFALGAVLYECLAGRPAFSGANPIAILAAVLHLDPAPPSRFNPKVRPEMDRITLKALPKQPAERYQTAAELAADLRAARSAITQPVNLEGERSPSCRPAKRSKAPVHPAARGYWSNRCAARAPRFGWRWPWWPRDLSRAGGCYPAGSYRPSPDAERWYREGVAALRDGTYYKASQALERAARIDDHFAMAHAHLAESWLELDYTDKAKDEMLRAVPPAGLSRPARAEQWYLDALHFTMTGNYAQAIDKYREIARSAPDDAKADAYVDLGRAWERNEKLPEAIAAYQEAIRRQRQNPAAWLRLGILYGRQADQPRAAEAFGEAEQLYRGLSNMEGATEVLYQRGVLANRVGKVTEARTVLAQALDMSGHTGSRSAEILALLQLSNLEFHAGNFAQSQADATQAIDLARANGLENLTTRGLIDLGNAYFQEGLNSQARKYFEEGLAAARRYHSVRSEARALLSLGSLEIQTGELDEGLGNVQQGYDWYQRGGYQKETAQALLLMSRAQRQKGDYPSALKSFEEQLAWAQKNGDQRQAVQARQGIASVLELEGRWPEALSQCRQAYDAANRSSDRSDAAYSLLDSSEVLWRLGRWDEARQALDQAVAGAPRALLLHADGIRAAMALARRQFPAAIEISRRLIAQAGAGADRAALLNLLGLAQSGSGQRAEGIASTSEAVVLAAKSGAPGLIAEAKLSHAEALLAGNQARPALDDALAGQQWFARVGVAEAEWRSRLLVARAEGALGQAARSREDARKAAQVLADLPQKWDSGSYQSYIARPDIQFDRAQLTRLAGAK